MLMLYFLNILCLITSAQQDNHYILNFEVKQRYMFFYWIDMCTDICFIIFKLMCNCQVALITSDLVMQDLLPCIHIGIIHWHVFYASLQSLEDELVRETILQLVSLKLWNTLSFGRLQVILGFFTRNSFFFYVLTFGFLCLFQTSTDGTLPKPWID